MENNVELKCETCKNYNKYCCMWNEVNVIPDDDEKVDVMVDDDDELD